MTRRRDERGASLILVLALVAFLALLLPAVFRLVVTGSKVTPPVRENRREVYAASSALDAAIALGRHDPDIGVPGGKCPSQKLEVDGFHVSVTAACPALTGAGEWCFIDRFASYSATVTDADDQPAATAVAEVVYRWDKGGWITEVHKWNPEASGPLPPATLPSCPSGTTTTSTTTTTTPEPVVGSYAVWDPPNLTHVPRDNGNKWRGEGTLRVVNHKGEALVGARVTIQYYELGQNDKWSGPHSVPSAVTNETGSVTFHSPEFNNAKAARFEIVSVTAAGLTWNSGANPVDAYTP